MKSSFLFLLLGLFSGFVFCDYDSPLMIWASNLDQIAIVKPKNSNPNLKVNDIVTSYKNWIDAADRVIFLDFHQLTHFDFSKFGPNMNFLQSKSNLIDTFTMSLLDPSTIFSLVGEPVKYVYTIDSPETFVDDISLNSSNKYIHILMEHVKLGGNKNAPQRFTLNDRLIQKLDLTFNSDKVIYFLYAEGQNEASKRTITNHSDQTNQLELTEAEWIAALSDIRQDIKSSGLVDEGVIIKVKNCSQLYLTFVDLIIYDNVTLTTQVCAMELDASRVVGDCDSNLELYFKSLKCPVTSIKFKFNFNVSSNDWKCTNIDGDFIFEESSSPISFNSTCYSIYAPYKLSYSCYKTRFYLGSFESKSMHIQFNNYQMQPTGLDGDKFSAPNDCVGFFTVPTILALLLTFFLSLVLAWALIMLFSLQSANRFEKKEHHMVFGE